MSKCRFWLLDVNYEVRDHKPELWMWGIDDEGRRVLIIDRSFLTYFYLVLDEKEDPKAILEAVKQQVLELPFVTNLESDRRRLFGKPVAVTKVFCQDPDLVPKYAGLLSRVKGVRKCLEDDVRYSMRYLVNNNVVPCGWHEIEIEEESGLNVQVEKVYVAKSAPKRIESEKMPSLRVLGFSIICHGSRGTPKPEKDPVVIISAVANTRDKKQFMAKGLDDKNLLESFVKYIREFDPDVIAGYETNTQYLQYLMDRSATLGLKLSLGRTDAEPHRSTYGHMSVTGRAHIDMFDFADELPKVKVKTLENVADYLGVMKLEKRLIVDEVDFANYWDDPEKRLQLLRFSMENAQCVLGVFEDMFDFALQLSQLVGLPMDQIGKAAVGFRVEWYLIREAYEFDELVPERIERPYIPYAGGMVLKPKPGIHENTAVLDFKSMYPSIMIEQNVSPDTYVEPSESEPSSGVNIAPEVGHRFRKEPPGFYKKVLSDLIVARDEVRRKMKKIEPKGLEYRLLDARQRAIKVITNASYGYAGWIGARWFVKPVAEATTAWGRDIIMRSINMAKGLGLDVIYGDTDSIFMVYDTRKTDVFSEMIREKLGLEIKPDKIYTRILFTEAKKRYCGLLPDGKLDMVGLEVVRGDWANVAKNVQEQVLELILKERSPNKAVDFVRQFIADLREKKAPYKDLIIWKTLTKPLEEYEVRAPHVEAARILKKEGWALTLGDKVGYVITSGSGRLYERVKPYALASYDEVDTEYYVKNQVVPAALRILSMFDVKEEDLLSSEPVGPKTLSDFFGGASVA